jgi:predicted nucleotidyltransferase
MKMTEQYAIEVTKTLNPKAIIVYGSYIKGIASSDSGIDIAVILEDFSGDYLEISKKLYKIRRNISADIEPILLTLASDCAFINEVLRTGLIVYQSEYFHFKNYIY